MSEAAVMMALYTRIGRRLAMVRLAGETQRTLADRLGVSVTLLSMTIREQRTANWLKAGIARLLNYEYEFFWEEKAPELSAEDAAKLKERLGDD